MFKYLGHVWYVRHRNDVWVLVRDDNTAREWLIDGAHDDNSAYNLAWLRLTQRQAA